jgi:hypothetical protein
MKGQQHSPYIICRRNHVSKPHVRGERRLLLVVEVVVVMVIVVWVVLSGRAVRLDVRSDNTGRRMTRASSWILDITRWRAH